MYYAIRHLIREGEHDGGMNPEDYTAYERERYFVILPQEDVEEWAVGEYESQDYNNKVTITRICDNVTFEELQELKKEIETIKEDER